MACSIDKLLKLSPRIGNRFPCPQESFLICGSGGDIIQPDQPKPDRSPCVSRTGCPFGRHPELTVIAGRQPVQPGDRDRTGSSSGIRGPGYRVQGVIPTCRDRYQGKDIQEPKPDRIPVGKRLRRRVAHENTSISIKDHDRAVNLCQDRLRKPETVLSRFRAFPGDGVASMYLYKKRIIPAARADDDSYRNTLLPGKAEPDVHDGPLPPQGGEYCPKGWTIHRADIILQQSTDDLVRRRPHPPGEEMICGEDPPPGIHGDRSRPG